MTRQRLTVPNLFGGISRQTPTARFPNQLETADNALIRVIDGAAKRPGSHYVATISDLLASGNYRVHPINRDATEKYLVVYGRGSSDMEIRVFKLDGTEATVNIDTISQAYLNANSSTADDIVMRSVADYTIICNKTVQAFGGTSSSYSLAHTYTDYETMEAGTGHALVNGEYYETEQASNGRAPGFWYYESAGPSFTRVPPSDQAESIIATNAAPQQMVRTSLSPLEFDVTVIPWGFRPNGDDVTNPIPSLFKDSRRITDIAFHRNRLVLAGDENVVFSRAGDFFELYQEDVTNLVDSDPIDVALSANTVTLIDQVVPFRKSLVIFTKNGRQFELNSPEALTPSTAAITASTSYQAMTGVQPQPMGSMIVFAASKPTTAQVMEYLYDDVQATNVAGDITAHVEGLLPAALRTLAVVPNENMVFVLPSDGDGLYVYRSHYLDNKKVQSAWSRWTYGDDRIVDMAVFDTDLYLLVELDDGGYALDRLPVTPEAADTDMPYTVLLDRKVEVTGVYNSGTGLTTFTYSPADTNMSTIVLGADFGDLAGQSKTPTRTSSTTLTLPGDYSAGPVYIGREYTKTIEFSRPYVRDRDGTSVVHGRLQLRSLVSNHRNTGTYKVRIVQGGRPTRDHEFTPNRVNVTNIDQTIIEAEGAFSTLIMGRSDETALRIVNDTPMPSIITAAEWIVDFYTRRF